MSKLLPNLIIGGVMKAGTTSLFTYLARHPEICASSVKETNYYKPFLYQKELPDVKVYMDYFKQYKGEKYIMEATPKYLPGGERLAKRISETHGRVRVIFCLRDPSDRLLSFYKHMKNIGKVPEKWSFDDYVQYSISEIEKEKDMPKEMPQNDYVATIVHSCYVDYLEQWYAVLGDDVKVIFFDDLKCNTSALMEDLCYWLGIDCKIYSDVFAVENRSYKYKRRGIHRFASMVNNNFEPFFRKHHNFKKTLRRIYYFINEDRSNTDSLSPNARDSLDALFGECNLRLFEMLNEKGLKLPEWLTRYA